MKNFFKFALSLFLFTLTTLSFSACSSDDDNQEETYTLKDIAGYYTGTLNPVEYTAGPARAYAQVTQRGKDSFTITITCQQYAEIIDNSYSIEVYATSDGDGKYIFTAEDGNIVFDGKYNKGTLSFSFKYNIIFNFEGTK